MKLNFFKVLFTFCLITFTSLIKLDSSNLSQYNSGKIKSLKSSDSGNKSIDSFINTLLEKPYEMNTEDKVSFSRNLEVIQKHLDFDIDIDMDKKVIKGKTRVHYKCLKKSQAIILDSIQLKIEKVLSAKGEPLFFNTFHPTNIPKSVGDGLAIMLDDECSKDSFVDIYHSTTHRSIGLHFSHKSVLKGKNLSFLATHGEAIYSRSYFPSQDTPSLKVTSEATVRINQPYTALFSGKLVSTNKIDDGKRTEYKYSMKIPIPTYLITFAAGELEKIKLNNSRCSVYYEKANKELARKIHKTFEKCEDYIKFYEDSFGVPFQFGEMVFLITPKDYPYRGMENPFVTYIAEVVLTDDHSYDSTLAHEIAHFWSGDLVTNKNWGSFWLNEGITTYTSRKAIKELNNRDGYYFELFKGLTSLSHSIKDLTGNSKLDKSLLSLTPNITEDPYATFSRIPYEKGSLFLYHIEKTIGEKQMYEFLGKYFEKYKFMSVSAEDFKKTFESVVKHKDKNKIDWDAWTKSTGDLPVKFNFKSKRVDKFQSILEKLTKEGTGISEMKTIFADLKIIEKDHLLDKLGDKVSELPESTKTNLMSILQTGKFFEDHITNQTNSVLLQAKLEKDEEKREKLLVASIDEYGYYGATHLKKVFKLLKDLKKYKENQESLIKILKEYEEKLNPLTYNRLYEKIKEK